jgi:branched-chain amino acid transport system permease protein
MNIPTIRSAGRPGVVFAVVVLLFLVPSLGLDRVWMGIALQTTIYAGPAVGAMILLGWAGQISLAQGTFMAAGAYSTALASAHYGLSPWLGLPIGIGVSAVAAVVIGFPVLRLQGLYLVMATAALNIGAIVIIIESKDYLGGSLGIPGLRPLHLFGRDLFDPDQQYYLALIALLVMACLTYLLTRSPVGYMLTALRHNQTAAALVGIPVWTLKVKVFVLSAVFAAVGGFFLAEYLLFVTTDSFTALPSLNLLVMVVIGGLRSIPGAMIGAAFVTILPQLIPNQPATQELIFAGTFLLVTMFVPTGLAGAIQFGWTWLIGRIGRSDETAGAPPTSVLRMEPMP